MGGSTRRQWVGGGLLAALVALAGANPAFGQTTSSGGVATVTGGFGPVGLSGTTTGTTGTTGTTATGTTGTTATGTDTTSDPLTEIIALAEALAQEFGIEFQSPWEELFFVMMVMELKAHFDAQSGATGTTTSGTSSTGSSGGTTSTTAGR